MVLMEENILGVALKPVEGSNDHWFEPLSSDHPIEVRRRLRAEHPDLRDPIRPQ